MKFERIELIRRADPDFDWRLAVVVLLMDAALAGLAVAIAFSLYRFFFDGGPK